MAGLLIGWSRTAHCQAPKKAADAPAKKPAETLPKKGPKGPQIPPPEDVTLETKDGVNIRATWYAGLGQKEKKESVPVIMVHGWEGQRGEYHNLAIMLQGQGHSIIAPDLRGHGQSTVKKLPDGETETIELDALTRRDLEAMVLDLEACKKFLMEKNNKGELNIEALCVVGADFGCIVAMRWAALDWSAPRLPAFKQGQDVKALVLLTPMQAHKGLTLREALTVPAVQSQISVMIVAGKEDSKGTADAKRLHSTLQAHHPKPPTDPEEVKKKQDLFLVQPITSLAGTKLLGSGLNVPLNISNFIHFRLVARQADFPWSDRKNPLSSN
jgi:dienelactone hydrolase